MNTLLHYLEGNGMTNERIESIPATELDHLLSNFFSDHMQVKWRRVQASNNFQFSAQN